MTLYLLVQRGVDMQAIGGIFSDLATAKKVALDTAQADVDSYHTYELLPFELNTTRPFDADGCFPRFISPVPVWYCSKKSCTL